MIVQFETKLAAWTAGLDCPAAQFTLQPATRDNPDPDAPWLLVIPRGALPSGWTPPPAWDIRPYSQGASALFGHVDFQHLTEITTRLGFALMSGVQPVMQELAGDDTVSPPVLSAAMINAHIAGLAAAILSDALHRGLDPVNHAVAAGEALREGIPILIDQIEARQGKPH